MASVSIRKKITYLNIATALLIIVAFLLIINIKKGGVIDQIDTELDKTIQKNLADIAKGIYNKLESVNDILKKEIDADLKVSEKMIQIAGGISQDTKRNISWDAINQYTKASTNVSLPALMVGKTWFGQNRSFDQKTPVLDEIAEMVGGTVTVFQKMNDKGDMLRVATNVKKTDGTRAVGTYIPAVNPDGSPNPVISKVMKGETFRGRAYVVNAWYLTAYKPVLDGSGNIIGVLYFGVRQEKVESIRKSIMSTVVGKTGYVYIMGAKGKDAGRYIISYQGKRDGEDISGAKDATGRMFIKDIVNSAVKLKGRDITFDSYYWKNKGESEARRKTVAVSYFKDWEWIIGAGAYDDDFKDSKGAVEASINAITVWGLMAGIILVIVAILLSFTVAGRITSSLTLIVDRMKDFASGEADLTKTLDIKSSDEVGELGGWIDKFIGNIKALIVNVKGSSEIVSSSAIEISSTTEEFAATIAEQNNQSQNVAFSVKELTTTSDEIASSIEETRNSAENSREMTQSGSESIKKSIDTLSVIQKQTENLSSTIGNLGTSTEKIGNIIVVINEIAEQTNLLALNAAIEAARAGEAGRGFAVVADEVRKLAERTGKATKEIENIISELQREADAAGSAMNETVDEVAQGTKVSQESLELLAKIVESSDNIVDSATVVATAIAEENAVIEEVNTNVQSIAIGAEESASAVQNIAETAELLSQNAEELKEIVDRFKVD